MCFLDPASRDAVCVLSPSRPIAIVGVAIALFLAVFVWRNPGTEPDSETVDSSSGSIADAPETTVRYLITRQGTGLAEAPGAPVDQVAGGVVLPVLGEIEDGFTVMDSCNREGWVSAADADQGRVPTERGRGMAGSVFVIDPGHGFPDLGAVGPSGLTEAEANIDVSARRAELLGSPRDIDQTTGAVIPGSQVEAAAAVILTRSPDGPEDGDYELGLTYRATVGNSVDATAVISIHHNTEPTTELDHPGSTAFVSAFDPDSARLGGLIVEELRSGLGRFEADWVGGRGNGLIARVGSDGDDYYTLLAVTEVTSVIVEGAYISNPSEEALIMTGEFRQAYADSVYRALVRFLDGEASPLPAPEPELFDVEAPPRSMDDCVVPGP
jgi:N-acetylmuramoyl-L-alanine amidase